MLEEYLEVAEGGEVTIMLTPVEEAAMLAVNSLGLLGVDSRDRGVIEEIIEAMVNEIWT